MKGSNILVINVSTRLQVKITWRNISGLFMIKSDNHVINVMWLWLSVAVLIFTSKHQGIKVPCPQFGAEFRCESEKSRHIRTLHESMKLKHHCDQCDYQVKQKGTLKVHIQSIHEGISYPCDKCDFISNKKSSLKVHKRSHEGIKYPCDQCEYQTPYPGSLKAHIEGIHKNIMMKCQLCLNTRKPTERFSCFWTNRNRRELGTR